MRPRAAVGAGGRTTPATATVRAVSLDRGVRASAARSGLGLGTRDAVRTLFRDGPDPRWVRAAAHHGSDVEPLTWPVELGGYGRGFGLVRESRPDVPHRGIDVAARRGEPVSAMAPGIVAYADNGIRGFGNCVVIVHPNGWTSVYAHLFRATVQPGWRVRRGERIGFVGSTGISRGPHLHFELREGGRAIDPEPHFSGRPWARARQERRRLEARDALPEVGAHLVVGRDTQAPPRRGERPDPFLPAREGQAVDPVEPEEDPLSLGAFLRRGPTAEEKESVEGEVFSTVLWPVRGSARVRARDRRLEIRPPERAAVRAAADARVMRVTGEEGDRTVALLHANGWVSVYRGLVEIAVAQDMIVERGEWLGHSERLRYELWIDGHRSDPRGRLAQVPEDVSLTR